MTWTLGIIGCGKMAYALLKGISREDNNGLDSVYICDPDQKRIELFVNDFKAKPLGKEDLLRNSNAILLAVKPNQIKDVLMNTENYWNEEKLLISIAAGIKTADLEKALPAPNPRVVRVMPNTPSMVGEGMSAICGGTYVRQSDLQLVQSLLNSSGKSVLLNEKDIDALTAISGCGPAYVFLMVEAMIEAGVNVGLTAEMARQLVLQTIKGSICMLEETGENPATLKSQVCSPAGATIAAVRQLEAGGVRKAFFDAVEAAYERSISLGKPKAE